MHGSGCICNWYPVCTMSKNGVFFHSTGYTSQLAEDRPKLSLSKIVLWVLNGYYAQSGESQHNASRYISNNFTYNLCGTTGEHRLLSFLISSTNNDGIHALSHNSPDYVATPHSWLLNWGTMTH